jgi:hypothetical protein
MWRWLTKETARRRQVREQRIRVGESLRARMVHRVFTWPFVTGAVFLVALCGVTRFGPRGSTYAVGQFIDRPIYAEVEFQVGDPRRTALDREAAQAATPSHYQPRKLTLDRIRSDALRLYEIAAGAESFETYATELATLSWPAEPAAHARLRLMAELPEDRGRTQFQAWIEALPLEREFIVANFPREQRNPPSAADHIVIVTQSADGSAAAVTVPLNQLVSQNHERSVRGSAAEVARKFPTHELRATLEAIIDRVFREQPTLVFDQERTSEKMKEAVERTPPAVNVFEKSKPFVQPGVLGSESFELLRAHEFAVEAFLERDLPEARRLRRTLLLHDLGGVALVAVLALGLIGYAAVHHSRIFELPSRTVAFFGLIASTLLISRFVRPYWPELLFLPGVLASTVLAIAYPRRFALGAGVLTALLITACVQGDLALFYTLAAALAVSVYQLDEIRSRTKLIGAAAVTALVTMVVAAAAGFAGKHTLEFVVRQALTAGGSTLLAGFVASGILPFIERIFRIATSLSLLEWRDPTRPLLQLLAHEAPGTYNHSLVVGTLAESACEAIGANGLLAQVGGLYHDVGKIPKAEYFAENQEGRVSRHRNLAPTMSLLIILGHVKDGIEMAKEYKLPRILYPFIEEHHGTTVVRYFHHVASRRQPRLAVGKHDREVPEAEFRYSGPKPRTRESAVVMLADGVEGAVRSLSEPTVGRIEAVVHEVVMDRLNDAQFDDCDITLKEIAKVQEALVKALCSQYHGRLSYPKPRESSESPAVQERASV